MDFEKVVSSRRSIRNFIQNAKIDREILEKILKHATLAPSSKNRQPWYFVVIQDDVIAKNKIADIMIEKLNKLKQINPDFNPGSIENTANIIKNAPCFVAVFDTFNAIPNSIKQSLGACIENMCLSATNYGIGSLWVCDTDICHDEIKQHLGITEPYSMVAGVLLGYAAQEYHPRPRKPLKDVCKFR